MDFEGGEMVKEEWDGGEGFLSWDVVVGSYDDIWCWVSWVGWEIRLDFDFFGVMNNCISYG